MPWPTLVYDPMKIVCIGRNYGAHARELGNEIPEEPVIFLKPPSALIRQGGPIRLPAFSNDVHHEVELVYAITRRGGKALPERVTLGLDLTARDLQQQLIHCAWLLVARLRPCRP